MLSKSASSIYCSEDQGSYVPNLSYENITWKHQDSMSGTHLHSTRTVLVLYQHISHLTSPMGGRLWYHLSVFFYLSWSPSLAPVTSSFIFFSLFPSLTPILPKFTMHSSFLIVISWRSPWCEKLYPLRWFLFTGWCPAKVKGGIFLFKKTSRHIRLRRSYLFKKNPANQRNELFLIVT